MEGKIDLTLIISKDQNYLEMSARSFEINQSLLHIEKIASPESACETLSRRLSEDASIKNILFDINMEWCTARSLFENLSKYSTESPSCLNFFLLNSGINRLEAQAIEEINFHSPHNIKGISVNELHNITEAI
ncbi:hypothetical protein [Robertkochia solimangrovi]|uniref:hypothetical protein n=1 Tax=Robertkochia solimangrovi TaxID=2213046 RepID=UPI001181274B|nr:hypothetical protein [Robertkochia solimangrovi]